MIVEMHANAMSRHRYPAQLVRILERQWMTSNRICTKCHEAKPATTEFYNLLPSGNWRGTCKSCMAENSRKHHATNPQQTAARRTKYKQNLESAEGIHTPADIEAIRLSLQDKCNYCGSPLNGQGEIDHKTPLSKGGSNWPSNLTLACLTCNRDKHSKTEKEFRAWLMERNAKLLKKR